MQCSSRNFRYGIAVTEYILGWFSSLSDNLTAEFLEICFEIEATDLFFLCCFAEVLDFIGQCLFFTCQMCHIFFQVLNLDIKFFLDAFFCFPHALYGCSVGRSYASPVQRGNILNPPFPLREDRSPFFRNEDIEKRDHHSYEWKVLLATTLDKKIDCIWGRHTFGMLYACRPQRKQVRKRQAPEQQSPTTEHHTADQTNSPCRRSKKRQELLSEEQKQSSSFSSISFNKISKSGNNLARKIYLCIY